MAGNDNVKAVRNILALSSRIHPSKVSVGTIIDSMIISDGWVMKDVIEITSNDVNSFLWSMLLSRSARIMKMAACVKEK